MASGRLKKRKHRQSTDDASDGATPKSLQEMSAAATSSEKQEWQGFCEIESEPGVFNVMLKEFGVEGVKVKEIFGLDEALLAMLPFDGAEPEESEESGCPENIWFANQTTGNACATVALLNIINNIRDVELGVTLKGFKTFTSDFTPPVRGEQITNFEFVKHIHNSFARKIDMMNIDLAMKHQFDSRNKRGKGKSSGQGASAGEEAGAFHFQAYIPIDGEVWRLDGLDRQPRALGRYHDSDWLSVVAPVITERMAACEEDQIAFGLLGLVKDPLTTARTELAQNLKTVQIVEECMDEKHPQWREFLDDDIKSPDDTPGLFGITTAMSKAAIVDAAVVRKCEIDMEAALTAYRRLIGDQAGLKTTIREERQNELAEEEDAVAKRGDFSPMIRKWLRCLAEKDVLKDLIEESG